jgi:hypothetical protein
LELTAEAKLFFTSRKVVEKAISKTLTISYTRKL